MKQAKQAFEQRWSEINSRYYGLFQRQREIAEELKIVHEYIKQDEAEDIVSGFLEDDGETQELKSKLDELNAEHVAINKKINAINSKGGLEALYQSDKQLKELLEPLSKELAKQAKEDEKQRLSLEKRYEKVIDEIIKLDKEKEEFERLATEKRDILVKINKLTGNVDLVSSIRSPYQSTMWHYYRHLGKVKGFSPERINQPL